MTTYKIVRYYFRERPELRPKRTIVTGLSLEQAQAHCRQAETSSSTCRLAANIRRTRTYGPWFDAYTEE